jgi:hypothetical protein
MTNQSGTTNDWMLGDSTTEIWATYRLLATNFVI